MSRSSSSVGDEGCINHHKPTSSHRSNGTLTARIIPRADLDYANKKPFSRRVANESYWRDLVTLGGEEADGKVSSYSNIFVPDMEVNCYNDADGEVDDRVVVLDIDIVTSIFLAESNKSAPVHVELHMQRQANESANRTLRRMELSTQRKILHGYRQGRKSYPDRESSIASTDDPTSCIMVRDASSSSSESSSVSSEDKELESDGYRQVDADSGVTIGQLLAQLREYSGETTLHLDGLVNDSPGIALRFESLPPTILSVQTFEDFSADVFVGVPLVVEAEVLHAERPLIVWFVGDRQVAFDCSSYTPTVDDVGKKITVFVSPIVGVRNNNTNGSDESVVSDDDYSEVYQYEKLVEPRPNLPIVERRASWISRKQENGDALRVMSYNLLADEYASREIDQQCMYNHCKREDIARTRRMPLLVYEMLTHRPDILCLQEVDEVIYKRLIYPVLKTQGYHGYYSTKASNQLEGCAMFWNLQVFQREAIQEQFPIRDLVEINSEPDKDWASMRDIHQLLDKKPDLKKVVKEKVGQVFQVATLRLKDPGGKAENVIVGNTHLFYHPMADHIRAIQIFMICMQIDRIRKLNKSGSSPPPFIICGDLNSDPLSGAVRLLLHRKLEPYHFETWKYLDAYSWEQGEEEFLLEHGFIGNDIGDEPIYQNESFRDASEDLLCANPESLQLNVQPPWITMPSSFPDLESGYETVPEFTNYAVDFTETLDYIFASTASSVDTVGFELMSSAYIPDKAEMTDFVAMPNENMPSDHVSIACDFKWVDKNN